jgi:signal transduction histidine kinase/DNA-binding NarL/FixJ family response regulator/HPt (histidine-containing phosphotransfer) domain-containing protein
MTALRSIAPPADSSAETVKADRQRRRLLSSSRLRLAFTLFVVALLLALSGMIFVLVSRIFDTLTPSIQSDLEWKARRGASELVHATELGIVMADEPEIKGSLVGYDRDSDILSIVVTDMAGRVLATHGSPPEPTARLFDGSARSLRRMEGYYVSWAEAAIEGGPVGRVAVVVSTARLKAGGELKRSILLGAGLGAVVAFLFALLFVRLYIGPIIRVTESAFLQLEKTTAQALEAARLKSEFLANMSHEIRTPMNGVLGMIELLSRTGLDEKQRRFLGTLQTSAGGLMSVLNDILDFSKIEAGKMELREESCRVRALVDEVTDLFAARAELRGVRIVARVEHDVPSQVEADTERVRQVLSNLVGNAVKFTESGSITVRASVEEYKGQVLQLRFEVIDTGIGIDPAQQGKLFDAFSQVDGSLTRKHGGTGLGLAICKQLVGLMKGRMGVTSEAGRGSNFWFVLPLRRLESTGSLELPSPSSPRSLAAPPSSKDGLSRKILVAEDNPINQVVIREVLSELGYEADIVENGLLALSALEQEAYPLVLMDCQMPELDGYGAAREIRRREDGARRIPLIAVTAHAFEGERQKALSAGMDDYVTKPISGSVLSEVIQRWWPTSLSHGPEWGERVASNELPVTAAVGEPAPALDPSVRRSDAVAKIFLKHVPDQVTSIGRALESGDRATLKSASHKLKGSCLAIGAPRMAELCAALEDGTGDAQALLTELRSVFQQAERELSTQLGIEPASVAHRARSALGGRDDAETSSVADRE